MTYYNYYDGVDWGNTKPGWYEASVNLKHYDSVMEWLHKNIGKYERHTRWHIFDETMKFKFRYEKDCMMFILRWS